ncbi:hypothetical protein FRP1_15555 [Pseudonocardia sp. EC080625-04]|nr:hypothetical protein FRP1_15555 [Pseudonocardia sp. EC080625-04]
MYGSHPVPGSRCGPRASSGAGTPAGSVPTDRSFADGSDPAGGPGHVPPVPDAVPKTTPSGSTGDDPVGRPMVGRRGPPAAPGPGPRPSRPAPPSPVPPVPPL